MIPTSNLSLATFLQTKQWNTLQSTTYGVILAIGLITNSWLLRSMFKRFKARSSRFTRWTVNNMCIADILYLAWIPLMIHKIQNGSWTFGTLLCKSIFYVSNVAEFTTIGLLTVLCIDRYIAVCHPITFKRLHVTWSYGLTPLLLWGITTTTMLPLAFSPTVRKSTNETTESQRQFCAACPDGLEFHRTFLLLTAGFGFFAPLVVMWGLYSLVLHRIWFGRKLLCRAHRPANARLTRIVFGVLTAYTCCYGPAWCYNLLIEFYSTPTRKYLKEWFYYIAFLVYVMKYINSAMNPIFFSPLRQNLRDELLQNLQTQLLMCRVGCINQGCSGNSDFVAAKPKPRNRRSKAEDEPMMINLTVLPVLRK